MSKTARFSSYEEDFVNFYRGERTVLRKNIERVGSIIGVYVDNPVYSFQFKEVKFGFRYMELFEESEMLKRLGLPTLWEYGRRLARKNGKDFVYRNDRGQRVYALARRRQRALDLHKPKRRCSPILQYTSDIYVNDSKRMKRDIDVKKYCVNHDIISEFPLSNPPPVYYSPAPISAELDMAITKLITAAKEAVAGKAHTA